MQKTRTQRTVGKVGYAEVFGLALQTYQRRGRTEIRLVGSFFIKRSARGSFFGNWDYTGEEKWHL
jgi:hypothetical protein